MSIGQTRPTRISRFVALVCTLALLLLSFTPIAAEASSPWLSVGGGLKIDVPAGYGSFADADRWRAGVQIFVRVLRYPAAGRIRFASSGVILGEAADGGFTPQGSLQAGFRAFAWGQGAAGAARMWTPDLGALGSLISVDPALPCTYPLDATTPVAGPFTITIPAGAVPGGQIVPNPTLASVYGNPARPAVVIRSENGILLGKRAKATPQGGFLFAGTIFAYGVSYGTPRLWTPVFNLQSTGLVQTSFVGCTSAVPGTVTLTEHLVPQDDEGLFDLQIDGQTKSAAVGDQGSTGPVEVLDGEHSVSELASSGTDLADYEVGIVCTEDTNLASPLSSSTSSLGQIPVASGDDWRCEVTTTRTVDVSTLTVQSVPETANGASKTIGGLGGTIEATATDGTRYSLFVPPGALAADTEIMVTPTAASGLESIATATPSAVEFAPAGLTFAVPAQLTITPAPGAPPVDFAASWEDGAPGVEIGPLRSGPDGSFVIDVPHFSGVASIRATIASYDNLLTLAILQLPGFGGLMAQLATDAAGLPSTDAAVVSDVQGIYDGFVKPLIDNTRNSLQDLRLASLRLGDFEKLYNLFAISAVQVTPPPNPTTLQDLLDGANAAFTKNASDFVAHYTTSCDAQVSDLAEWFAVPLVANAELQTRGVYLPYIFCVRAESDTIFWSTAIDPPQTSVSGLIRGVVSAPAQTPGGILKDGRALFPQSTEFILHSSDGTFAGAGNDLHDTTNDDGLLGLQLDRDPGPQGLIVDGVGKVGGIWAEAVAVSTDYFPPTMPVHLVASTGTISVSFRSPPTNIVLPYGQTTNLCVDVADGDGLALASTPVDWTNDGPGLLAATTSTTNSLGIACMDYQHPAGPVTQGDTATITATATSGGDTGSDAVTLTPQWARITIETRPNSQSAYSSTTNTTVQVNPGEHSRLRITVTESGATPTDPPQPVCEACPLDVRIENGGGELLWISENINCGVQCFVGLDANGQVELDWDPQGTSVDTTILVTYPPLLLTNVPGVAATVTFTQQAPPGNVNGTIGGTFLNCEEGGILCMTTTYSGSFQLNVSASVYPGGGFLASVTGQLNWTANTQSNYLPVCHGSMSLTETFSGSQQPLPYSQGTVGFAQDDPSVAELGVTFSGTYTGCNGVAPDSGFTLLVRGQPVYQAGQLVGFDFNGTTAFPNYHIQLDAHNSVAMTVSGFVPLT